MVLVFFDVSEIFWTLDPDELGEDLGEEVIADSPLWQGF